MASTVFVDGITLTDDEWFNHVNAVTYNVLGDATTPPTSAVEATKNLFKKGTNIASATTTNLAAATGNYVHITGTTTIASFGTVNAGVPFMLVFDGALTLTHNATSMILPGAANITTAAGDTAIFVSEGSGNWKCISYILATPVVGSYLPLSGGTLTGALTTNGQVVFPAAQNASAGANTLDDYEEGTWTPEIGGTATYSSQDGTYTKIGNRVFIECYVKILAIGSGSDRIISGLPFAAGPTASLAVSSWGDTVSALVWAGALIAAGESAVRVQAITAASASSGAISFFKNSTWIRFGGSYII